MGSTGYPGVAQLVARLVRDEEAVGSNPVTRTSGGAPAGNPYLAPSFEGALPLHKSLAAAKKLYHILWYKQDVEKTLPTLCKPVT